MRKRRKRELRSFALLPFIIHEYKEIGEIILLHFYTLMVQDLFTFVGFCYIWTVSGGLMSWNDDRTGEGWHL